MHLTHLTGIVNTVMPGQTDITLHGIDRRRVEIFDFTGTGASPDLDADPDNYEVATGNMTLANFAAGKAIVAKGFPNAFGAAPPDFAGRTVIDYTDVRSALGVGWGVEGTVAPFASIGPDGLTLDNDNDDIDVRHYIKQGPVLIDLTVAGFRYGHRAARDRPPGVLYQVRPTACACTRTSPTSSTIWVQAWTERQRSLDACTRPVRHRHKRLYCLQDWRLPD